MNAPYNGGATTPKGKARDMGTTTLKELLNKLELEEENTVITVEFGEDLNNELKVSLTPNCMKIFNYQLEEDNGTPAFRELFLKLLDKDYNVSVYDLLGDFCSSDENVYLETKINSKNYVLEICLLEGKVASFYCYRDEEEPVPELLEIEEPKGLSLEHCMFVFNTLVNGKSYELVQRQEKLQDDFWKFVNSQTAKHKGIAVKGGVLFLDSKRVEYVYELSEKFSITPKHIFDGGCTEQLALDFIEEFYKESH